MHTSSLKLAVVAGCLAVFLAGCATYDDQGNETNQRTAVAP